MTAAAPTARQMRVAMRRRRRAHREPRPLRERAGDAYTALLTTAVLGGVAVQGAIRVAEVGFAAAPAARAPGLVGPLGLAAAIVLAGAGLRALLAVGPVVAGPAVLHWLLATPVDRRSLLAPRLGVSATIAAVTGAFVGAVVGAGGGGGGPTIGAAALLGASLTAGLFAGATLAQTALPAAGRLVGGGLVLGGFAVAVAAVAADAVATDAAGTALPSTEPLPGATAVAGAVLAAVLLCAAWARLGRLDRRSLTAGGGLAVAARMAGTMLDPTILTGLLEERRWRRVGAVGARPFTGTGPAVLLRADLRRARRAPGALPAAVAWLVVAYAAAAVLPAPLAPAAASLAACVVAGRYAAGLRAVSRSPSLRRTVGGSDRSLTLVHLAVPLAAATAWTALTLPALAPTAGFAVLLIPVGAAAVAQRVATRRAPAFDGSLFDTPLGAVPVGLVGSLVRGPALAVVLAGTQVLLATAG